MSNTGRTRPTNFLYDVTARLVDDEAKRDDAINARAVAVVALSGVVLTLTASSSKEALGSRLQAGWRVVAVALVVVAVVSMAGAAALSMIGVLRPRRFAMLAMDEAKKFLTPEYLDRSDDENRRVLIAGLLEILEQERRRAARKTRWLKRSYTLVLIALAALGTITLISAFQAGGIIPTHDGYHRPESAETASD